MRSFDWSILLSGPYHAMLLAGLRLSLTLLGATFILALPLGALIALARLSPFALLRGVGAVFIESQRNVPLLAHLLFWYFGAPELLPDAAKQWLYSHDVETIAAVVAITLYYAAFMSEDMRSGIRSIAAVQFEAARALGLPWLASMRLVVLPQALRVAVPPLLSQTLNIWKDTSVATVIGTAELMYQAARVESASFRSVEAFTFATVSYLAVSLLISALASGYHRRFPPRAI
ncbi:amino acid ABC transporter permease [Paraburkholderia sp. MMS20-SJTN17]|uniref:Amino acid ABC transporter permease n=1 Tax=Paraburkholderia translucens TaxID=2886945 RepID=A0ABS8KBY2_9BURK|nr:amino acid ABC transporter permease [Paraburkholderia sp. MMS20-SJTN17]MCC8402264.1 amino acid ABC transporter permease [Paraburkholderia sp. MMS20-SJTN17]